MINNESFQVLIGSVLGDGSLSLNSGGLNAFYEENHSAKEKEYLLWKWSFFDRFSQTKVTEYSNFDERTKKTYHYIRLRTHVLPFLTEMRSLFYIDGKKVVPTNLLNQLNTLGLAVWYFDDGSYCYLGRWSKIATCDFSFQDNILLSKYLEEAFGLESKVYKNSSKWYELRFNVQDTNKLFGIIVDAIKDIPVCLRYKLGLSPERERQVREKARFWESQNKEKRRLQHKIWIVKKNKELNRGIENA